MPGRSGTACRIGRRIHISNGWTGSAFQSHSGTLHRKDTVKSFCRTAGGIFAGNAGCFSDFVRSGILSTNENVEKIIARLKNGEPE